MPAGYTGNEKFDQKPVDLVRVAQSVGAPSRDTCITCHGFGGGDNVKHGDIDSSMKSPDASYDVHMGTDAMDFTCQECHTTNGHKIKGNALVVSPGGRNELDCTDCHGGGPHDEERLIGKTINRHLATVACQTCHIPAFAKDMPTKVSWDWSTAGQEGRDHEKDRYGKHAYAKKKGDFVWEKNVVPTYAWYNGTAGVYERGDKIDPGKVTRLSYPKGSIDDPAAKIYPFKVHEGRQPYDTKYLHILTPKVWPGGPDAAEAYWKSFDWDRALKAGAAHSGVEYSGEYGFAPTVMYWRINHMVVPADRALKCSACHGRDGRLDWQVLGYQGDPSSKLIKTRAEMDR